MDLKMAPIVPPKWMQWDTEKNVLQSLFHMIAFANLFIYFQSKAEIGSLKVIKQVLWLLVVIYLILKRKILFLHLFDVTFCSLKCCSTYNSWQHCKDSNWYTLVWTHKYCLRDCAFSTADARWQKKKKVCSFLKISGATDSDPGSSLRALWVLKLDFFSLKGSRFYFFVLFCIQERLSMCPSVH